MKKRATASAPSPEAETNKTKKTKKQVIKKTMHGQKDLGIYSCMFGGSAARANPNIKLTVRGRMNAGIDYENLS